MTALLLKAVIRLELGKMSATDPKRSFTNLWTILIVRPVIELCVQWL